MARTQESPPDTQVRPQNPLLASSHLFSLVLLPCYRHLSPRKGRDSVTHQHAVIPVLVEEQHSCFRADRYLLLGGASVVGVKDGLAPVAEISAVSSWFISWGMVTLSEKGGDAGKHPDLPALARRGEIQEQCPRRPGRNGLPRGLGGGLYCHIVRVVVCARECVSRGAR